MRGGYDSDDECFFIYKDKQPVKASAVRTLIRTVITSIGLEGKNYDTHSMRVGRTGDLIKFGYSVEDVCKLGRWRSSTVYKYIRNL